MIDSKKSVKRELNRNIRSISILIIVIVFLYFEWSITGLLRLELSERLIWAIDFSVYSALLSIIFSIIYYLSIRNKVYIKAEILNQKEESSSITLNSDMPERVRLVIDIEGKSRFIPSELKIALPHWIDIQPKPKPYVFDQNENNICIIDINYLIKDKVNVKLTDSITIDLIRNTDEENKEAVEAVLELGLFTRLFFIKLLQQPLCFPHLYF